jgi:hypothetical protein
MSGESLNEVNVDWFFLTMVVYPPSLILFARWLHNTLRFKTHNSIWIRWIHPVLLFVGGAVYVFLFVPCQ